MSFRDALSKLHFAEIFRDREGPWILQETRYRLSFSGVEILGRFDVHPQNWTNPSWNFHFWAPAQTGLSEGSMKASSLGKSDCAALSPEASTKAMPSSRRSARFRRR